METGMPLFRSCLLPGLLLTVFMMAIGVNAGEEECIGMAGKEVIRCYECTADRADHYCGDPFNSTHPNVKVRGCKEYCVKWTRTTLSGITYFQRTCSDQLEINMRKSPVCIEESRPSHGMLCFCEKDNCNAATSISVMRHVTLLLFLALLHVLVDHRRVQRWT